MNKENEQAQSASENGPDMTGHESKESQKSDFALQEEKVLDFWRNNETFKQSLDKPSPKGEFVFFDGPPFATGLPHYGHILAGVIKDAIPRYQTMRGHHVERRWGWDCHGLPIENLVQKENGLKTKEDIEEFGIKNFAQAAKNSVFRYDKEWKEIVPRTGRWVDMEDQYTTMDPGFMESVWWAFSELNKKGLVYEGFRSMHISPALETSLSNFEVNQNYKDITDISVYAKFELEEEPGTFLIAWTTTPWTLFANVALAVGSDISYVKLEHEFGEAGMQKFIIAKDLLEEVFKDKEFKILEEFTGDDLVGKKYKPIFDHYAKKTDLENRDNGWKVYAADFVTTEDGTGIVHVAPAFGEDDLNLGQSKKLPFVQHVNIDGSIKSEITELAGKQAKPAATSENPNAHQQTDIEVIKLLAHSGHLFEKKKIIHSYPHCWRTDVPLLNYALSSWFVKVTDYNQKMFEMNKKVNWVPKNVGEKRFGNWLENVKDWGVSRSRYWGTSMPIWKSEDGEKTEILGSVAEIRERTRSTNNYFIMRHGQADHNVGKFLNADNSTPSNLTEKGRTDALATAKKIQNQIKKGEVDLIYCSPLIRTKQTAEIVMKELGISEDRLIIDDRIQETQSGIMNGKKDSEYLSAFKDIDMFTESVEGGESFVEIKKRMGDFIYDVDQKNSGKNILIISHDWPLWMLESVAKGFDNKQSSSIKPAGTSFVKPGEFRWLDFAPIPHDDEYVLDLHRPYIDDVTYEKDGKKFTRIPEVFDTWVDSGSMPYAVPHYPFEDNMSPEGGMFKGGKIFSKQRKFPADFIAEGLDQTRGWFYTLLALNTALFGESPYKNVVVNGLVLAEDGRKMSKSLKNYPDPSLIFDKYGADAMRYYLLSSPIVEAEPLAFSEKGVDEIYKKIVLRLLNVVSFYEMYRGVDGVPNNTTGYRKSPNILDKWIIARLDEVVKATTDGMNGYKLADASRPFMDFVDDLSTWYIRRSRDRFKGDDSVDRNHSLQTTRYVLNEFSKVIAPFMPFLAETVYQRVEGIDFSKPDRSVHLENWPDINTPNRAVLDEMKKVRDLVSLGLLERDKAGIKVRQPLQTLKISIDVDDFDDYSIELIRDEINVKKVVTDSMISEENKVSLDTEISKELREEGIVRELIRFIQTLRKKAGLNPGDEIVLKIQTNDSGQEMINKFSSSIEDTVNTSEIKFVENAEDNGEKLEADNQSFVVSL